MRKQFYFSAMICVLLSVFAFSASADYYQPEQNAYKSQDDKKTEAQNKNQKAGEARRMKKFLIFTVLAFFAFGANGHSSVFDSNDFGSAFPFEGN